MNTRLTWIAAVLGLTLAHADDLSIKSCTAAPSLKAVEIVMSTVNPPIGTGSAAAKDWTVEIKDANGDAIPGLAVTDVTIASTATDHVILSVPGAPSLVGWSEVFVTFRQSGTKTLRCLGQPPDKPKKISGADSKDGADVYLMGSYSPRIGSPAQYSYDVAIGYQLLRFSKDRPQIGLLGLSILGSADQRKNLDPDSYYAGVFWQAYPVWVPRWPLQGVVFQLDTGGELSRKDLGENKTKTSDYLAPSPRFEFPMRLFPPFGSVKHTTLMLRPILGVDWGKNFQNALQPDGSGLIARGLAGADFVLTYKTKKAFRYSFTLSSSWRGRFPWRKEIDTTSVYNPATADFDYTFQVTRKPRNHISSSFEWKWTEYFGISVTHELGALPPLFNYVDNSVTIGFTFSAKLGNRGVLRRQ
jgi:hypothetical protein